MHFAFRENLPMVEKPLGLGKGKHITMALPQHYFSFTK
jgi:hypothetical protein